MTIRHFLCFLFFFASLASIGQSDSLKSVLLKLGKVPVSTDSTIHDADSSSNNMKTGVPGKVTLAADSAIVYLEKNNRRFRDVKGYRIQIFLGTVEQSKLERNKFLSLGLPYSIYSKQIIPEQALVVGDFLNRMEMEKNLEIIRKHYPKAFGVVELIEPPKFSAPKKR